MSNLGFLKESFKNMKTVGSIVRTSKSVAFAMANHAQVSTAKTIVELGSGDGAITRCILEKMNPDAKLICFELNPVFCDKLRLIQDSRLEIIQDSAQHLEKHLQQRSLKQIDCVISAIPFVNMEHDFTRSIIGPIASSLGKDRPFVQIHYSLLVKKIYQEFFSEVNIDFMPIHIPPAFVFICKN